MQIVSAGFVSLTFKNYFEIINWRVPLFFSRTVHALFWSVIGCLEMLKHLSKSLNKKKSEVREKRIEMKDFLPAEK